MAPTATAPGPRWPVWALVALLGAATAGLTASALADRRADRSLASRGVLTTGTVTAARQLVRVPDEVDVRYVDRAGRPRHGTAQVRRPLAVGTSVTVRYDPRRPTRIALAGDDAGRSARPGRVRESAYAAVAAALFVAATALALATRR